MNNISDIIFEIMYIISGIIFISTGVYNLVDKKNPKRFGTAIFWTITGIIFIAGPYINPTIVGGLLILLGLLTVTKNIEIGSLINSSEEYRKAKSEKIGNKIFIPALSIGVVAFAIAQFTNLGGLVGLGFGALVSLILTLITTKENPKYISYDSSRVLQQVERVAINIDDGRIPDNEGYQPIDTKIFEDGENAYFSSLPIKAIVEEIKKAEIPASISNSAGTYVCNHIMYSLLYYINKNNLKIKGGFIHVPYTIQQIMDKKETPFMELKTITRGLETAIKAIKNYKTDIKTTGGKEF